jgi:hypothetical protein
MNFEGQWTVYRTRFLVRARQLTEQLVFTDALGREQSGEPGDYLVESSDGVTRITTQALFEDIYVPLTPALLLAPAQAVESAELRKCVPANRPNGVVHPVSRASPELHSYPSA